MLKCGVDVESNVESSLEWQMGISNLLISTERINPSASHQFQHYPPTTPVHSHLHSLTATMSACSKLSSLAEELLTAIVEKLIPQDSDYDYSAK